MPTPQLISGKQLFLFYISSDFFAESYVKLQYFVTALSHVTFHGNVCTHVRWVAVFNTHTVQLWLMQLLANFDGNLLTTFKVIAKNLGLLFVDMM